MRFPPPVQPTASLRNTAVSCTTELIKHGFPELCIIFGATPASSLVPYMALLQQNSPVRMVLCRIWPGQEQNSKENNGSLGSGRLALLFIYWCLLGSQPQLPDKIKQRSSLFTHVKLSPFIFCIIICILRFTDGVPTYEFLEVLGIPRLQQICSCQIVISTVLWTLLGIVFDCLPIL